MLIWNLTHKEWTRSVTLTSKKMNVYQGTISLLSHCNEHVLTL